MLYFIIFCGGGAGIGLNRLGVSFHSDKKSHTHTHTKRERKPFWVKKLCERERERERQIFNTGTELALARNPRKIPIFFFFLLF